MKATPPRVSVIIATYNRSEVLRYAIESVLWQTFGDFELLVVGDGCTDDSAEVVASFGDARIQWWNLPENSGHQSAPNNAALRRARGEFIAYLGHDDLWHPTHLARLVEKLERSGADLAYSWLKMIWPPPNRMCLTTGFTPRGKYEDDLIIPPSSLLHRRAVWQEVGDWPDYRTTAFMPETDFLRRARGLGKEFVEMRALTVFKFNASYRPDCYRERPSYEQAEYMRRMREEPDFLEREWMDIVESSLRRHPEDVTRVVIREGTAPGEVVQNARIFRGVAERTIPQPLFPEMPVGRIEIANSAADDFLVDGWSQREDGYRWSDGELATLSFSVREVQDLQLRIDVAPFLGRGLLPEQKFTVELNGQLLTDHALVGEEVRTELISFPETMLRLENLLLLHLPNATSPLQLEQSGDPRRLAIRVYAFEFVRA